MGIDKSNPFERDAKDGTDVFMEYGPGGVTHPNTMDEPGVSEGTGVAVAKGVHGSLSDVGKFDGGSET